MITVIISLVLTPARPPFAGVEQSVDVAVNAEDRAAVDQDLGEDVEHRVMDFSWRWHQQSYECQDDAERQEPYGCPLFKIGPHD